MSPFTEGNFEDGAVNDPKPEKQEAVGENPRSAAYREAIAKAVHIMDVEGDSATTAVKTFLRSMEESGQITDADRELAQKVLDYPGMPGRQLARDFFAGYNIPNNPAKQERSL